MKKFSLLTLLALWFSLSQAQTIQCEIDSVNNTLLLTSNYMSYCSKGMRHTKSDERYSMALNFYSTPTEAFYILCLPIVTDEVQTVRKGNKLKVLVQGNDTITLKCSSDFTSKDMFHEDDKASWVVLPKYHCTEKTLRRLLDENVLAIYQEMADGTTVRMIGENFYRWRFSKTLSTIFKELNKQKPEKTDAELLFNNGRYQYVKNDTVISTKKGISFSDKWMY